MSNASEIARMFDEMAAEYDDITDFWYSWLFSRLHYFLAQVLLKVERKLECLDIGCGTGFQTNLLAMFGHDAIGIDISGDLLDRARAKDPSTYLSQNLFESPFAFAHSYSRRIQELARLASKGSVGNTEYCLASATSLPFESNSCDLVVCCGSTLNFIPDYKRALCEMARVLRSGGLLFLEVENRYNLDLYWALADGILPLHLNYEQNWHIGLRNIFEPRSSHVMIDYPFETHSETICMPLRLFSASAFAMDLQALRCQVLKRYGIHNITNLVPSTLLHNPRPTGPVLWLAQRLAKAEELISSWPFLRSFGCSAVYLARKE